MTFLRLLFSSMDGCTLLTASEMDMHEMAREVEDVFLPRCPLRYGWRFLQHPGGTFHSLDSTQVVTAVVL